MSSKLKNVNNTYQNEKLSSLQIAYAFEEIVFESPPGFDYVSRRADIHPSVKIEPYSIIEDGVTIGASCHIGSMTRISRGTVIGQRSIIGAFCNIGNDVEIGDDVTIRSQANINWKTKVGNRVVISEGVTVGNDKVIGKWQPSADKQQLEACIIKSNSHIGIRVVLLSGAGIGHQSTILSGSVVAKSVPDYEIWSGSPAKKESEVPNSERLPSF